MKSEVPQVVAAFKLLQVLDLLVLLQNTSLTLFSCSLTLLLNASILNSLSGELVEPFQ
jgi:hypothetical protein